MMEFMPRNRVRLRWRGLRRGWRWSVIRPGRGAYGVAGSLREARVALKAAKTRLAR